MPKKRSTRNSNNSSINISDKAQIGESNSASESGDGNKHKKQKETPYYSWW